MVQQESCCCGNEKDLLRLEAYCDADHAGDKDCKSTTGFIMFYGSGPITWASNKQKTVATSSVEAEYIAAATCVAQLKFVRTLIEELLERKIKVTLHMDNTSAIRMIKSGQLSTNSHHIDIKFQFVHDELN
jgi:dsRNA-specific ribonuclease